jgi:hypothetical protein
MAVVAITPTALVTGTASADLPVTAGTAINAANTNTIAYPKEGKLLLVLNNTYAGSKDITIAAGNGLSAGQGALTITMAQDDVKFVIVNSSRHKNTDGNIVLSYAASTTGFVQAFYLP